MHSRPIYVYSASTKRKALASTQTRSGGGKKVEEDVEGDEAGLVGKCDEALIQQLCRLHSVIETASTAPRACWLCRLQRQGRANMQVTFTVHITCCASAPPASSLIFLQS